MTARVPGRLAAIAAAVATAAIAVVALAAAPAPAQTLASASGSATGTVRGRVAVLQKPLLGDLRPADDAGGALVYVTGFQGGPPRELARLRQHGEQFVPRLLPVVAGQRVSFPNEDPIYHNVFSVSPVQPFDLGQYKGSDPPREVVFERAGLVPVYCNIHPQMLSYVVVLENGAWATTAPDGSFAIEGVPAGERTVNAWLPGAQRTSQAVRVEPGAAVEVALELRQTEKIGPHKRKDGTDYPKKKQYKGR